MNLNKIFLIGRLTRDPEQKFLPNGTAITKFSIAVNRSFKKQDGKEETDFVDCIAWSKLAEIAGKYLSKGSGALVEGRLQIRTYEDSSGSKRKVAEVIADNIQFLDSKPKEQYKSQYNEPPAREPEQDFGTPVITDGEFDEDIPF